MADEPQTTQDSSPQPEANVAAKPARKPRAPKPPADANGTNPAANADAAKPPSSADAAPAAAASEDAKPKSARAKAAPAKLAGSKPASGKLPPAPRVRASRPAAAPPVRPARVRAEPTPAPRSSGRRAATVIGAAAAGLAAGLVANLGRKAAVQAPSIAAGDWLEAVKGEHRATLLLFDALEATKNNQPAKRNLLLTQIGHALSKHAYMEENAIYPALREWGDKADADKLNHDHGYVKQYLYELGNMEKNASGFLAKVASFRADLESHIREEEDSVFPPLHAALSPEKNKALTFAANKEGFKLA